MVEGSEVKVGGARGGVARGVGGARLLADRTGLTGALSGAVCRRGFTPVHVLVDAAVCIADGGRCCRTWPRCGIRDQAELYGPVASDTTLWRALEETGQPSGARIATARARTRRHVWKLIAAQHVRIQPPGLPTSIWGGG